MEGGLAMNEIERRRWRARIISEGQARRGEAKATSRPPSEAGKLNMWKAAHQEAAAERDNSHAASTASHVAMWKAALKRE